VQYVDDQSASRIELDDGTVIPKCDQCRQMYAERKPPGIPPCDTCRVELKFENEEAANIYMLTRRQVVTAGMGQIIDINTQAVKIEMDIQGVGRQKECSAKVRRAFQHFNRKEKE